VTYLRAAVVLSFLTFTTAALAQPTSSQSNTPTTTDSANSMDPPLAGDHWTYEVRDEITGTLKFTMVNVVTQVTPNDIAIRVENLGNPGFSYLVYDHSWNMKDNSIWKNSPGDGTGIKTPLKVGSSWNFQSSDTYAARGLSYKRSGFAKVVAQETITTTAGTFDTFKIEATAITRNANDPTKKSDVIMTTWYAPSADHWIKRTSKVTLNGHLDQDFSFELIEYGRR
jgi:hypothetical protein